MKSWVSKFILALTGIMMFGTVFGDVGFSKLGIPLNITDTFGTLPYLDVKLFTTEIYFLALLLGSFFFFSGKITSAFLGSPLSLLLLSTIIYAFFRAIPDFKTNPLLIIRNSAFVWYLFLPLLLQSFEIRKENYERLFWYLSSIVALVTIGSGLFSLFHHDVLIQWYPQIGVCAVLAAALKSRNRVWPWVVSFGIGICIGATLFTKMQRTSLFGIFAVIVLSTLWERKARILILKKVATIGITACAVFFFCFATKPQPAKVKSVKPGSVLSRSFHKAEANVSGIENFRRYMWRDAWEIFAENPIFGVGFEKQVVYRLYAGGGEFYPNDGTFPPLFQKPPVSGPHNSYLNALARLGIFGILVLVAHVWAFFLLIRSGYEFAAWTLFAQAIYAMFNVGLEGPTRSFSALMALALALECSREAQNNAARHAVA